METSPLWEGPREATVTSLPLMGGLGNVPVGEHVGEHVGITDPAQDPCAQLIRKIQQGDADAFRDLYHRYGRTLLLLLLRRTPDQATAEKALEHLFTQIWNRSVSLDSSADSGRAWLCALAAPLVLPSAGARNVAPRNRSSAGPHRVRRRSAGERDER